jgi:ketosteroid isomerase-like protein
VSDATASAKELGLAFLQAFWDGDLERGYALCAPDARWTFQRSLHDPVDVPVRDAVEWLMSRLVSGFVPESGYTVQLRDAIGEANEAAVEYSATGRTRRGEVYHNRYVVRFTAQDGRIVSIRPYFDTHYVSRTLFDLDAARS